MLNHTRIVLLLGAAVLLAWFLLPGNNVSIATDTFQSNPATYTVHEPFVIGSDGIPPQSSRLETGGIPLYAIVLFLMLLIPAAAITAVRRRR